MVVTQKVTEGPSNLVLSVYFSSDGAELNNYVLLSPSDLVPPMGNVALFRIMQIWYSLTFGATLSFNSLVPRPVWVMQSGIPKHMDFRCFGGVADYNNTAGSDGKLLISTLGYSTGANGSMVLELRKPKSP